MTCREDGDFALEDGSHTVFLSTCGENEDEVPAELVKFLKYVKAGLKESSEDFQDSFVKRVGYTGALKAPVRCFGNHLSGKGKSSFQTDNECSGAAILKK